MFSGVYTALVTPFSKGRLDESALKKLIELQVKGGVDGIVPVGTTGESPTVDFEEHVLLSLTQDDVCPILYALGVLPDHPKDNVFQKIPPDYAETVGETSIIQNF